MFPLEGVGLCPLHLGTVGDAPLGLGVNHQEDRLEKRAGSHASRSSVSGPPEPGKLLRSPVTPTPQGLPQSQGPPCDPVLPTEHGRMTYQARSQPGPSPTASGHGRASIQALPRPPVFGWQRPRQLGATPWRRPDLRHLPCP